MRIYFALLLLSTTSVCWGQVNQPPFSIKISVENPEVKVGSEIHIKIQLKNESNHDVDCSGAPSNGLDRAYQYEVLDDSAKMANKVLRSHPEVGETFSVWACSVKPGETANAAGGIISRLYDMRRPGRYTIQVSRAISDNPKDGVVKSNKITVTVTDITREASPPPPSK